MTNESGENLLNILLSRTNHNIKQMTELCKKLIGSGVDINQLDENGRVPLQYSGDFAGSKFSKAERQLLMREE